MTDDLSQKGCTDKWGRLLPHFNDFAMSNSDISQKRGPLKSPIDTLKQTIWDDLGDPCFQKHPYFADGHMFKGLFIAVVRTI